MLNLLDVKPGETVKLRCGAAGEVIENIGDGIWVLVRFTTAGGQYAAGDEELVHCEQIDGPAVLAL